MFRYSCEQNKNRNDFRFSVAATNSKIDLTEYPQVLKSDKKTK